MRSDLTIRDFHQRFQKSLQLSFASRRVGLDRQIKLSTSNDDSYEAVDFLNAIRPSSVILIGCRETTYLSALNDQDKLNLISHLANGPVSCIILSKEAQLNGKTINLFADTEVPVFKSELKDTDLLNNVRYFLNQALAEKMTAHGVYIDIYSIGTFISGESGIGKSELALSLIARGHRLIADDIVEFSRVSPETIDGIHPGLSNDFMEVRGLGILNIRAMYGSNALRRNKKLHMIVDMVPFTTENSHQFDRLGSGQQTRNILGMDIPELTLPVAPGRNLAVLVETAARNHILKKGGYNSAEDFIEHQRLAIKSSTKQQ